MGSESCAISPEDGGLLMLIPVGSVGSLDGRTLSETWLHYLGPICLSAFRMSFLSDTLSRFGYVLEHGRAWVCWYVRAKTKCPSDDMRFRGNFCGKTLRGREEASLDTPYLEDEKKGLGIFVGLALF